MMTKENNRTCRQCGKPVPFNYPVNGRILCMACGENWCLDKMKEIGSKPSVIPQPQSPVVIDPQTEAINSLNRSINRQTGIQMAMNGHPILGGIWMGLFG